MSILLRRHNLWDGGIPNTRWVYRGVANQASAGYLAQYIGAIYNNGHSVVSNAVTILGFKDSEYANRITVTGPLYGSGSLSIGYYPASDRNFLFFSTYEDKIMIPCVYSTGTGTYFYPRLSWSSDGFQTVNTVSLPNRSGSYPTTITFFNYGGVFYLSLGSYGYYKSSSLSTTASDWTYNNSSVIPAISRVTVVNGFYMQFTYNNKQIRIATNPLSSWTNCTINGVNYINGLYKYNDKLYMCAATGSSLDLYTIQPSSITSSMNISAWTHVDNLATSNSYFYPNREYPCLCDDELVYTSNSSDGKQSYVNYYNMKTRIITQEDLRSETTAYSTWYGAATHNARTNQGSCMVRVGSGSTGTGNNSAVYCKER